MNPKVAQAVDFDDPVESRCLLYESLSICYSTYDLNRQISSSRMPFSLVGSTPVHWVVVTKSYRPPVPPRKKPTYHGSCGILNLKDS